MTLQLAGSGDTCMAMGETQASRDMRADTAAQAHCPAKGKAEVTAMATRTSAWSHAEHLLYLLGLESHGRGAWRAISTDFCISRTPSQVASHAQKYFARQALTPLKRHKTRPSIHDITRDTIHPLATASDRDTVRLTLQRMVRDGSDVASAVSTGSSGTDSNKSALSNCLPIQDPTFSQVFAFSAEASAAASGDSGCSSPSIIFHTSPQPLQYASMHVPPGDPPSVHGYAAATPNGQFWAVSPVAGPVIPQAAADAPPGSRTYSPPFPVAFAAANQGYEHQLQPQFAYYMPYHGPGVHMWPPQQMMHAPEAGLLGQGASRTSPAQWRTLDDQQTHLPPFAAAPHAQGHAAEAAAPAQAGCLYQLAAGTAGGAVQPYAWPDVCQAWSSLGAAEASPQLLMHPPAPTPLPGPQGGDVAHDRGTKRDSFEMVDQERLRYPSQAKPVPAKAAKGATISTSAAPARMHALPSVHPTLHFIRSPERQPFPPPAPKYASATMPEVTHATYTCMCPDGLPWSLTAPSNVQSPHAVGPVDAGQPRFSGCDGPRSFCSGPAGSGFSATSFNSYPTGSYPIGSTTSGSPGVAGPTHSAAAWIPASFSRLFMPGQPFGAGASSGESVAHAVPLSMAPVQPDPHCGQHSEPNMLPHSGLGAAPPHEAPHAYEQHMHECGQLDVRALPSHSHSMPPVPPVSFAPHDVPGAADPLPAGMHAYGDIRGELEWLQEENSQVPPSGQVAPFASEPGAGAVQDMMGLDDLVGYLLGNGVSLGDSACIDAIPWEVPRPGSSPLGFGSGSGSGGEGSGGSGGGITRRDSCRLHHWVPT